MRPIKQHSASHSPSAVAELLVHILYCLSHVRNAWH